MPKFDSETEELILEGVRILDANGGNNVAGVAARLGVNRFALTRRWKGIESTKSKGGVNSRLNDTQSHALIQWILRHHRHGFPLTKKHVVAATHWILKLLNPADAPPPTPLYKGWFARWVKARPLLHEIITTPLNHSRKAAVNPDEIAEWFEKLRVVMEEYGITPRDIQNMDETGFMVGMLKSCTVLVPQDIKKCYVRDPGAREMVTCVECVSAAGEHIPSTIIAKGSTLPRRQFTDAHKQGHDANTKWCTTDSGFINEEKALLQLDHFDELTKRHQQGVYRLLLLDGHASHTRPTFVRKCWDKKIIPFCLLPHSTHLLQPLDVAIFGPYKHYHNQRTEKAVRAGIYNWGKDDFLAAQPGIKKEAFKKSTIMSSYKHTGIWPLDPKRVLENLKSWCEEDNHMTPEQAVHRMQEKWLPIDPYTPQGSLNGVPNLAKNNAQVASDLAFNYREGIRRELLAQGGANMTIGEAPRPSTPEPTLIDRHFQQVAYCTLKDAYSIKL